MSNFDLVQRLFLQLGVILLVCRCISYIGTRYFKQTTVVCEMMAGIILGPSLFGLFFPSIQQWLFPTEPLLLTGGTSIPNQSMTILFAISQIGVVFYMFVVGSELNIILIRGHLKHAGVILIAGIVTPLIIGFCFTPYLYSSPSFFGEKIRLFDAMLFVSIVLSITAFPVLARILDENNITKTKLGTLVLAASSMTDVIAWCLLALILAIFKHNYLIVFIAFLGTFSYVLFMLTIGKHALEYLLITMTHRKEQVSITLTTIVLSIVMFCAWFTDFCGIHAIFGGFIAGVAMPRGKVADELRSRTEYLTQAFFLPIFFVYSGLNTQIGLLNSIHLVTIALIVIVLAFISKGVGCTLAAKFNGENWNNSLIIGVLMNARGLMELIVLNIGLSYGIITPTLFTIFVLMTIVTTLMASPLYYYLSLKQDTKNSAI